MPAIPPGYTRFETAGAEVVALIACADAVRQAIAGGTLHAYAERHASRRQLHGRGKAYAVPLPDTTTRVVVRHSQHGGLLAPLTGDRFLAPTRAPRELSIAVQLTGAGVATPDVVAYATYPAWLGVFRRSDVATREVAGGRDLATVLAKGSRPTDLSPIIAATAALLRGLEHADARHPDLNLGNVLIVENSGRDTRAFVIDVDRVVFDPRGTRVTDANVRRLIRSAQKLRDAGRIDVSDQELSALASAAGRAR